MLELITLLNPQSSGYISSMQNEKSKLTAKEQAHHDRLRRAGRAKACPQCRGRRGKKIKDKFIWCARCEGSGKLKDTGGMTDTRVSKSDAQKMTAGDVATLLNGLPQYKIDAALSYVNEDPEAIHRLTEHLKDKVAKSCTSIASKVEITEHKINTMAALIVAGHNRKPGTFLKTGDACSKMRCKRQEWLVYWEVRLWDFTGSCDGWVKDVSIHMAKKRSGKRRDEAA